MPKKGSKVSKVETPGDTTKPQAPIVKPQPKQVQKPEPEAPAQKIAISLDVSSFQNILDQRYNDGRLIGFREGVKYIVTLAEGFLVEHEKLSSRRALTEDSKLMPTWWIATLVAALHHEPPYAPVTPKKVKRERPEPDMDEPNLEKVGRGLRQ